MFTVQQISDLTGLSRSQVDQMISRHGFKPTQAALESGTSRRFTRADALRYCLISALREIGLPWDTVRDIDLNSGFSRLVFQSKPDEPTNDYPHEDYFKDKHKVLFVVSFSGKGPYGIIEKWDGEIDKSARGELCEPDLVERWIGSDWVAPGAIILDFSAIVHRVDAALIKEA